MALLLTVTGPDKPGITSALTEVLASSQVALLDIEQVVLQGQLTLCLLVDLDSSCETVLKDLLFVARNCSQSLEYRVVELKNTQSYQRRYAVTMMGSPVTAHAVNCLSTILASYDANIDSIRRLSDGAELTSIEVSVTFGGGDEKAASLKEELIQQLSVSEVDIALQRESLTRRSKRLVVLDMDSTLISIEVIDELAKLHSVSDAVSVITHEAMSGRLDFCESLRRRVALLKGLSLQSLRELVGELPLNPGAEELIAVLKGLGYKVGIISGGFDIAADLLKNRLGLDFAYANRLDVSGGVLTGKVIEPIVDAEKKADLLAWIAHKEQIPLEQTIAIGDGANDAFMLSRAGLGIAFHAKPVLKKAASASVSSGGLERILYLLGMNARDIKDFLA